MHIWLYQTYQMVFWDRRIIYVLRPTTQLGRGAIEVIPTWVFGYLSLIAFMSAFHASIPLWYILSNCSSSGGYSALRASVYETTPT